MKRTRILICGSREFYPLIKVRRYVRSLNEDIEILVGDARGVDKVVYDTAKLEDIRVKRFEAAWDTHGRKAGIMRNLEMLDKLPRLVVAFWNGESPGTKFMIDTCLKRHINLKVVFEF